MKADHILLWSLAYLVVRTSAAEVVDISYTSQGYPHFYLRDTITFSCTATGFSDIILLELVYNDTGTARSGCQWSAPDDGWGVPNPPIINSISGLDSPFLTLEYCGAVGKAAGFTFTAEVTITDKSVRGNFYCKGFADGTVLSSEVPVTSVKVAPSNLRMFISPEVIENQPFTVLCNSSDADPVSDYKYGITRGDMLPNNVDTNSYTPTKEDRKGITVTCTDSSHPYWSEDDTKKTQTVLPKFIEAVGDKKLSEEFNPKSTASSLNCAEQVTGHPKPNTFKWKRGGLVLVKTLNTLTLEPKDNGIEESVICVAGNGIGKTVNITWAITWTSKATIPTTSAPTTTTPKPPCDIGCIIGIVIGFIAAIIFIIISIVCWKKYRTGDTNSGKGGHAMGKIEDSRSQTKLVSDNGNPKPKPRSVKENKNPSTIPKAQSTPRHIDDPIIYADLIHENPSQKVSRLERDERTNLTKPYPPPQESVEYASIDHFKTRKHKEENEREPSLPTSQAPLPPIYGNA